MLKAKVKSIKKEILQLDNSDFLDVEVDFLDGNEVIDTRKYAFPFGTNEKEIEVELKKAAATIESDIKLAEESRERDRQEKNADQLIKKLEGATL